MSLTTDSKNQDLHKVKENGQNEAYLVLSEEEKAKGFVRPVRTMYTHKGREYKHEPILLDKPEYYQDKVYVAKVPSVFDVDGSVLGSTFITQDELDQWNKSGGFIGGCNVDTKMAIGIAETYARDPNFYGATFCAGCNKHIPVGEFVWYGTNEKVGS